MSNPSVTTTAVTWQDQEPVIVPDMAVRLQDAAQAMRVHYYRTRRQHLSLAEAQALFTVGLAAWAGKPVRR